MRKIITSFIVLLFTVLGVFNIYRKVSFREPSDGIIWSEEKDSLVCKKVLKKGIFIPEIKEGDILLEVNGMPVNNLIDFYNIIYQQKIGANVRYYLLREDSFFYSEGELIKKGTPMVYFFLVLIGFSSLFISYYIIFLPSSLTRYSQNLFFLSALSFYSIYVFSPTFVLDTWDKIFWWLDKTSFFLFPAFLFHFFLSFPTEFKRLKKLKNLFYIIGVLFIAFYFPIFSGKNSVVLGIPIQDYQNIISNFSLGFFSTVFLLTLVLIFYRYKTDEQLYTRNQLKWIFWGITGGFVPFFLFYILPFFSNPNPPEWAQFIVLSQLIIPLTFAYAISGYKLMDFEIVAKKYVVYVTGFILVFSLYVLIITNFAPDFQGGVTIGAAAILLGVLVLKPLFTFLEEIVNRVIYRKSYFERENLVSFSKIVTYERDLKVLSSKFLEILTSAFLLKKAAIYLFDEKTGDFILLNRIGDNERNLPMRIFFSKLFVEELKKKDFIWFYSIDESEWLKGIDKTKVKQIRGYHILPLLSQGKIIGFLTMDRKIDGTFLTTEDWSLLLAISPSISLAIENASLYSDLQNRIEEIKSLKDFSENILDNVKIGIMVINKERRIEHWNRFLEELFGVKKDEAVGQKICEILGNMNTDIILNSEKLTNEPFVRIRIKTKDKSVRNIEVNVFNLDSEGMEKIILMSDVTEKLSLERELITREKLASLGLLSAGIVHEINTPLTGIFSYSQILQSSAKDKETKELAERINAQADRMKELVRSLLSFSRDSQGRKAMFDLREAVEQVMNLIEYQIKKKKIKMNISGEGIYVFGEKVKIQQVIINLVLNAIDASDIGGEVSIELKKEDENVIIEVIDRGKGIKKDDLPFIFDPFFTTKGLGKGTGLGLSITYNIIKEHGGEIFVHSKLNVGTKFRIVLPPKNPEIREDSNAI